LKELREEMMLAKHDVIRSGSRTLEAEGTGSMREKFD